MLPQKMAWLRFSASTFPMMRYRRPSDGLGGGLRRGTPGARALKHVSLMVADDAPSSAGQTLYGRRKDMSPAQTVRAGRSAVRPPRCRQREGCSPKERAKSALRPSDADLPDRPFRKGSPRQTHAYLRMLLRR